MDLMMGFPQSVSLLLMTIARIQVQKFDLIMSLSPMIL
jgi:hypothetical protein